MRSVALFILLLVSSSQAQILRSLTASNMVAGSTYPNSVYCDICVYGGTSGGVVAAIQAERMGRNVALICTGNHLGGMTSSGLGYTDVGINGNSYIQGVSREFYGNVGFRYGLNTNAWTFEPSVAEYVFNTMVTNSGVPVYLNYTIGSVTTNGNGIVSLTTLDGVTFYAKEFIDASYEGDLMAMSGVSYVTGRESTNQYTEVYNGTRLPNWVLSIVSQFGTNYVNPYNLTNDNTSGLLYGISTNVPATPGSADNLIQGYGFRLCLTTNPADQVAFTQPSGYTATNYEPFFRWLAVCTSNNATIGISNVFNLNYVRNGKFDFNSGGPISLDLYSGSNNLWVTNIAARSGIQLTYSNWTEGLIWAILSGDARVPSALSNSMTLYGWPLDEFTDNNHRPILLYPREARRMVSDYVMTESNAIHFTTCVVTDSVALAGYSQLDSHNTECVVSGGSAQNEGGFLANLSTPYGISYHSIVPHSTSITNLLVPWSLSSTHSVFGGIRLEPTFMELGMAAGVAATIAMTNGVAVQNVNITTLQGLLQSYGQKIAWP